MLKVKNIQQLKATYVLELSDGEFFEFELGFDATRLEWALVGENQIFNVFSRFSEAELKAVLKIVSDLNARDVKEQPKKVVKKAVKKPVSVKKNK